MLAFTGGLGGLWLWDEHRAGSQLVRAQNERRDSRALDPPAVQ